MGTNIICGCECNVWSEVLFLEVTFDFHRYESFLCSLSVDFWVRELFSIRKYDFQNVLDCAIDFQDASRIFKIRNGLSMCEYNFWRASLIFEVQGCEFFRVRVWFSG